MLRTGKGHVQEAATMLRPSQSTLLQAVLSPSSIRHILRVLRAALQDAVDEELLSRNVARRVQLRVTDDRKVRSFTHQEAVRFLQTANTIVYTHCGQLRSRWGCDEEKPLASLGPTWT